VDFIVPTIFESSVASSKWKH